MPTEQQMHDAVHAYIQALNDGHLDGVMALYAPDAVVEDPVGTPPKRGEAEIRAFYAGSLALKLQVKLEGPVRALAGEAVFPFSVSFVYGGRPVTIEPIDHFRFDDQGRIVSMRAFFGTANQR